MRGDILIIDEHHKKAAAGIMKIIRDNIMRLRGKYVISIGGESGSGKSEIAASLAALLGESGCQVLIIQQDDYFVYPPKTNALRRKEDIGRVGIQEVRMDLLDQNLMSIIKGEKIINKPLVIFEEDRQTEERLDVTNFNMIIAEGTYTTALKTPDCKIFIDRDLNDTRESRKKRGREVQDDFLEKILQIEHRVISTHKALADIIITCNFDAIKKQNENQ